MKRFAVAAGKTLYWIIAFVVALKVAWWLMHELIDWLSRVYGMSGNTGTIAGILCPIVGGGVYAATLFLFYRSGRQLKYVFGIDLSDVWLWPH